MYSGVKTAVGVVACVAPIAGSAAVACLLAGGRELAVSRMLAWYGGAVGLACWLFIWTLAFGIRQPSEARVGLVGMSILVTLCLTVVFLEQMFGPSVLWVAYSHPLAGVIFSIDNPGAFPALALVHTIIAAGLCSWAAFRFGKPGRTPV